VVYKHVKVAIAVSKRGSPAGSPEKHTEYPLRLTANRGGCYLHSLVPAPPVGLILLLLWTVK
jgi:hypothetical protein